jgi:hypothetical protein
LLGQRGSFGIDLPISSSFEFALLKKSPRAAEQDRPDVAAARKALQKRQQRLDPKRLVFIDETSVSTTITRLHGQAPQGEGLVQKVPHGNWKIVTFVAALRHDRVTAPFVLEGPTTGERFKAYIEQFLVSTLKRGDIFGGIETPGGAALQDRASGQLTGKPFGVGMGCHAQPQKLSA